MKRLSRFLSIIILVVVTGGLLYTAFIYEEQKQMEEAARLAAEQADRELKAQAMQMVQLAAAEEVEKRAAQRAALEAEAEARRLANPIYDKEVNIAELQETTNADIYAWIYIPDTMIDYPVLQHPTSNSYYLDYNLDGSKGYPGCIYTENYNSKDFTDPVTVLYGHNMKNGSMFAGLHEYKDSEYFQEHSSVYIYREEDILEYKVFAAYEYSNYHILLNHNFNSKEVFKNYLNKIFTYKGNFDTDVELTEESRILTLSTCVANKGSRRYLVQAVLSAVHTYEE